MAAEHETVVALAQVEMTKRGARVFKNAMGQGYVGKLSGDYESSAGHVMEILGARRVTFGVCNPGGSDLIGWRPLRIMPGDVPPEGLLVAQFVACECKTAGYNTASKDQKQFLSQVALAGGVAVIARREGDAVSFEDVGT